MVCIEQASKTAADHVTMGELRKQCTKKTESLFGKRITLEKSASANPFAILPHKPNFLLPVTYFNVKQKPYGDLIPENIFDNVEAKFQVSIKYVVSENFFVKDLDLSVAYTATSWWQTYNSNISSPFRETNYEPELLFNYNKPFSFFGLPVVGTTLSFNHESNGQPGILSRSWNRVIAGFVVSNDEVTWALRTWWRLPEKKKSDANDTKGDDNPDIEKYLGYGELGMVWSISDNHNLEMMLRNNLRSNNKGAIRLGWSFPLSKHLRGYIEYFNGYGESLIYYNENISRLGIGVKLTDWL